MLLTSEQSTVVEAFTGRQALVVEAGAGSGKTSTLVACAKADPGRRGVYLAYNKAIATEAGTKFGSSVECRTMHSLAYATTGRQYAHRLKAGRMPIREVGRRLGLTDPLAVTGADGHAVKLAPAQLARLVMGGIVRFCYSDRPEPYARCFEQLAGVDDQAQAQLAGELLPILHKAWADMLDLDGVLPFSHDCYLKIWSLGSPRIRADYLMLDEAQDANRLQAAVVKAQTHCQTVLVGDACQQLYAWRGAVDAMADFDADARLYLTQSFRFGQAIADEANKWLALLDAKIRLRGFDQVPSRVVPAVASPDAILCRTNAGTIRAVMSESARGQRVALVGDTKSLQYLAEAAGALKAGRPVDHPELAAFATWAELQEYADKDGTDLAAFVKLVDSHGADVILDTLGRLRPEADADVTISTGHRSKGREWDRVRVGRDFKAPKHDEGTAPPRPSRPDAMLAYVTVTRAKLELERASLDYIDDYGFGPCWSCGATLEDSAPTCSVCDASRVGGAA